MNNLKVVEMHGSSVDDGGRYFEVAAHVRDILQCEYAIVATVETDSLRVQAIAGTACDNAGSLAVDLLSKLGDWGPVVVDDSRLVVVPIQCGQRVSGLLIGYSTRSGTFTGDDLGKLMVYSHIVADMLEAPASSPPGATRSTFTNDELLHLSRLITIGELSACFAHEVTNPLMLIRGHLRFIDETLTPDNPLRISYEVIDRASRRIEEMAKRMLDFSRKRTPRTEVCDVAELISDTLRFMQPYFQGQYIDVQIKLRPDMPPVKLDRWHMVQAMVNLLQNAADAMADADKRVLTISARAENNEMIIEVADTGTGIATATLPRVFNPFFTTKGERGTGLGLYITKRVIEDHNGDIRVETTNHGTTFVISLPL